MRVVVDTKVIVSSDQDLLVLHPFETIPIVKPADFLRMLEHTEQI